MTDIDLDTPTDRLTRQPRPMNFIRVRLYRGGQAEYLRNLLLDEQEELFAELGKLRGEGMNEDSTDIEAIRTDLRHIINILRDVNSGMIELAGPDGL